MISTAGGVMFPLRFSVPLFVVVALFGSAAAWADAPAKIAIQGYLYDSEGQPVSESVDLTFRAYESSSSVDVLHVETQTITVTAGAFYAVLGSIQPFDLNVLRTHSTLFIGITVSDDSEMVPRLGVTTAPYAGYAQFSGDAESIQGAFASDFAATDHAHAYTDLTGIPATFPPTLHGHSWADLTDRPADLLVGDDTVSRATVVAGALGVC
jgi:hypothetical protein